MNFGALESQQVSKAKWFFFGQKVHVVALEHPSCEGRQLRHMWRALGGRDWSLIK